MTTALHAPSTITDATRREFLALLGATGLITGCATTDAPPTSAARTIAHPEGELVLTGVPQRVLVSGVQTLLDELLALGIAPVAFGVSEAYGGAAAPVIDPWTQEALRSAAIAPQVITANDVNIEQIAALAPDLLIRLAVQFEVEIWAGTTDLVPALPLPLDRVERLRLLAETFALDPGVVEELEHRRADLLATVDPPAGLGLTVVFPTEDGAFAYTPSTEAMSQLLDQAGLPLTDRGAAEGDIGISVAEENLLQLDDDLLVVVDAQVGESSFADALEAGPLFARIPAVAQGRYRRLTPVESRALLFATPLSLPYAVDALRRLIA